MLPRNSFPDVFRIDLESCLIPARKRIVERLSAEVEGISQRSCTYFSETELGLAVSRSELYILYGKHSQSSSWYTDYKNTIVFSAKEIEDILNQAARLRPHQYILPSRAIWRSRNKEYMKAVCEKLHADYPHIKGAGGGNALEFYEKMVNGYKEEFGYSLFLRDNKLTFCHFNYVTDMEKSGTKPEYLHNNRYWEFVGVPRWNEYPKEDKPPLNKEPLTTCGLMQRSLPASLTTISSLALRLEQEADEKLRQLGISL